MSYTPFNWLARIGQGLNIFTDQRTGQVLELNSTPTSIDQEGTPFSVTRMNALEQGLANVFDKPEQLQQTTAALFGLGSDYVPDSAFQILAQAALYKAVTPTAQLGTLPEGSIIYLNENGSPVPFYVAKQGYEPDYNTDRVLVVRKDAVQQGAWNASGVNTYDGSTIDTWFTQTYLSTLDGDVQTAIGTTNIPYTPGEQDYSVKRISKNVFALSLTELGLSDSNANVEGTELPISEILSTINQWTRSPETIDTIKSFASKDGSAFSYNVSTQNNYLPAFTFPNTFTVNTSLPNKGLYDIQNNLLLKLPGVQIETGSYTGTGTYGSGNPNTLTFGFKPKLVVVQGNYENTSQIGFIWQTGLQRTGNIYYMGSSSGYQQMYYSFSGNTLNWYSSSDVIRQCNVSGQTYYYVAIG